jgi:chromosome segregation ATPase
MGQVGQLTAQLQVLEGQVEALYSLGGQEDELDQLQGQVMMMQGQQTALVGQVSALEGQVASRGALVQCLTEQLLEVEEERRELQVTLQEVRELQAVWGARVMY